MQRSGHLGHILHIWLHIKFAPGWFWQWTYEEAPVCPRKILDAALVLCAFRARMANLNNSFSSDMLDCAMSGPWWTFRPGHS